MGGWRCSLKLNYFFHCRSTIHFLKRSVLIYRVQSETIHCNARLDLAWRPCSDRTLSEIFEFIDHPWTVDINPYSLSNRNLPSPAKQQKLSTSDATPSSGIEIPHVLQGEIARLDQKFKVSLDPSSQNGTKLIKLVCCLDSQHLPCVPPVSVVIPGELYEVGNSCCSKFNSNWNFVSDDYPFSAPSCKLIEQEYNATPFLISVQGALIARISKLPKLFSLSHLLDTWEMSVRQACSPALNAQITPTHTSVLLGI